MGGSCGSVVGIRKSSSSSDLYMAIGLILQVKWLFIWVAFFKIDGVKDEGNTFVSRHFCISGQKRDIHSVFMGGSLSLFGF